MRVSMSLDYISTQILAFVLGVFVLFLVTVAVFTLMYINKRKHL